MNIEDYSAQALSTLSSEHGVQDIDARLLAQVFGLVGESGEVAEKFKKIIRDKGGVLTQEDRDEIAKELGDSLWYVNSVAHLIGTDLQTVATRNIEKLASRKSRGVMGGSGDNR